MINLIPHNAKQAVKREYLLRVVVVYLCLAAMALFMAALLMLPSYLHITTEAMALQSQIDTMTTEQAEAASLQAELDEANTLLQGVESFESLEPLLPAVYDLERLAGDAVQLNRYLVERAENKQVTEVVITGVANSRVALASFEDRLEQSTQFGEVVVPLANLARDQDIPFTLTVPVVAQP